MKGIYGVNGSGKSAIITSIDILKHLLLDSNYLKNSLAQKHLNALINKQLQELDIDVEYVFLFEKDLLKYHYKIVLEKNDLDRYIIGMEQLTVKNATSHSDKEDLVFSVQNGKLTLSGKDNEFKKSLKEQTVNLLDSASMSALFMEKMAKSFLKEQGIMQLELRGLISLFLFGYSLFIYVEYKDEHMEYLIHDALNGIESSIKDQDISYFYQLNQLRHPKPYTLSAEQFPVPKMYYEDFQKDLSRLLNFLHIFKQDLKRVRINRKEDGDYYICNLIMDYEEYSVFAEFESNGIKKLISLYDYFNEMMRGNIVFIDELDSNIHDVYLCALLEYLMEHGTGQMCFTTHNIGPMDVLKKQKKSIDFLSTNGRVYPWITNGHYSPSSLYRKGMIEGSPFNIFSFDFLNAFPPEEEE